MNLYLFYIAHPRVERWQCDAKIKAASAYIEFAKEVCEYGSTDTKTA